MWITLEEAKQLAEIFAVGSAGGYFLYKLISGYFIVNLTINLNCDRQVSQAPDKDLIAVIVTLDKEDRGSLELHDASVKVEYKGGSEVIKLVGFERNSYGPHGSFDKGFKEMNWAVRSKKSPFLRMTPGEKTQLTAICLVPSHKECIVQASVLGKKTKSWKIGQWKAACVSLPLRQGTQTSRGGGDKTNTGSGI